MTYIDKGIDSGRGADRDYMEYMGNPDKSTGVFSENGILDAKEKKELRKQLRKAKGNIWDLVISTDRELGKERRYSYKQTYDLTEHILPKLFERMEFSKDSMAMIADKVDSNLDESELKKQLIALEKKRDSLNVAKNRLATTMDELDPGESDYELKYTDMQKRLDGFYSRINENEEAIKDVKDKLGEININNEKRAHCLKYLTTIGKLYDKLSREEQQTIIRSLIERIDIYPERQKDGRIIKSITFAFPLAFSKTSDEKHQTWSWDKKLTVETVVRLSQKHIDWNISL